MVVAPADARKEINLLMRNAPMVTKWRSLVGLAVAIY